MTAHLNPLDPAAPLVEHDCHVTPPYLAGVAGPTRALKHLLGVIDGEGWRAFTDHHGAHHYYAPDSRACVAYVPDGKIPLPGVLGSGFLRRWHLWSREGSSVTAAWHATVTDACPPELLYRTILVMAEVDFNRPLSAGEYGTGPLAEAGWERGWAGRATTYTAPDGQATLRYTPPPDYVPPSKKAVLSTWRAEGLPHPIKPPLWRADFTATTPLPVITAFCAQMADPTPLPRRRDDLDPDPRPYLHARPCAPTCTD